MFMINRAAVDPEGLALEAATKAYDAVRSALAPRPTNGESKFQPDNGDAVLRTSQRVAEIAQDSVSFADDTYAVTSDYDSSGDPQISYDVLANEAVFGVGRRYGAEVITEEDERRSLGAEGPQIRGDVLRRAIQQERPILVADPVDGSHQCAAMFQPGAYCHVTFTRVSSGAFGAAIALGSGRAVYTDGRAVWETDLSDPFAREESRELYGPEIMSRRHYRNTWVLPAYKASRLAHAQQVLAWSSEHSDPPLRMELLSPLAGNAGVLSSVILAPAGATAAFQPDSWAWDQIVFYFAATLGLPVANAYTGDFYEAADLASLFVRDLVEGRKSEALVLGKSFNDAMEIRAALIGARVIQPRGDSWARVWPL